MATTASKTSGRLRGRKARAGPAAESREPLAKPHAQGARRKPRPTPVSRPKARRVGVVLELWPSKEQRQQLSAIAAEATFAENAIWEIWRKHDPIGPIEAVALKRIKQETGRYPRLEAYYYQGGNGQLSPSRLARQLCPNLKSYVYDAIANHVRHFYGRYRRDYLMYWRRLPVAKDLRIRFRERAVHVLLDPEHKHGYRLALGLERAQGAQIIINLAGRPVDRWSRSWLDGLIASGEPPSGGTIYRRRRRGRWNWYIALARERGDDEREQVALPVAERTLVLLPVLGEGKFLRARILPASKQPPWQTWVDAIGLLAMKERNERRRQELGRSYAQSPGSGSHGHGRQRALLRRDRLAERYNNCIKAYIETRTCWLVNWARRRQCSRLWQQNLTALPPEQLPLGSFPYFQWQERLAAKTEEAGLEFKLFDDFDSIRGELSADEEEASEKKPEN